MSPSAIVIGSGMGGMVSAVLLAMHGYSVTVFEQHYRPGGLLHRFFRAGKPYDTGFHYLGGISRDDILGRCLRHLDVFDQVQFLPMNQDGFDRLIFPEFSFDVPVGWDRYRDRLKSRWPHESEGIDAIFRDFDAAIEQYGLYVFKTEVDVAEFLRWETAPLIDVLRRHISDPQLLVTLCAQCVLYGVPPDEASFGLHAVIIHHFVRGAHRLDGGGDRLARVMVQRIKALGGTVQLRSKVEEVLMEGRRAVGVRLTDGSTHHADLTVSNVHPRVLLKLLPDDAVRQAYRSRVMDQKVGVSHLGVYIELDTPATCIGNRNIYRVQTVSPENIMDEVSLDSVPSYFATAPAEAGGVSLARGHHVVLMMVMVSWEQVELWKDSSPGERPQEYQTLKRALQDQAVRSLLSDFPQLDGHIVRVEASTPLSTENFTSSPKGAVYGHYHSVEQMGRYRPSQVIRVRDLIQVGHGVFTPGVLGATMSAYYGCAHYLGMDNLLQELDAV